MGRKDKKKHEKEENQEEEPKVQEPQKQEEPEDVEDKKKVNVLQPKKVQYCPICTFPFEICKYNKKANDCKKFLMEIAPAKVEKYHPGSKTGEEEVEVKVEEEEKKQKPNKKEKSIKDKYVIIDVKQRMKKKFTTNVSGLTIFKIDSKELTKKLSKKFACSCSAQDANNVVIQGDFFEDVKELLINDYKVKKKYILDGEQFKEKQAQEKEKKKQGKMLDDKVIPEEPEEEKKEPEEEKPKYKTAAQQALADLSDDDDQ